MRNARNCLRCKNGKSKRGSKHLVCVGGCGQCRERLVSVSGRRRRLPPRLDCPPSLFCLCPPYYPPPPRAALHQISIGSKMVATHLDFTTTPTSFINSTSRALAAGARSQSILRSTLDIRPGRMPQDGRREREVMRRVRQVLGPLLLPTLTCLLQRLKHQPAALVVSLIWLLLACRLPGSCCRAGSSVVEAAPARPPVRPVVIPPQLILSDMPQSGGAGCRGRRGVL